MQPAPLAYKSGLYWRRSPINGRKCVPVILTLQNGFLTLTSATELVFGVPLPQVRAKFSKLSTMFLHVGGRKYPIVGRGGAISPQFTPAQIQELQSAGANIAPRPDALGPDFVTLVQNIAPWKDILRAYGIA